MKSLKIYQTSYSRQRNRLRHSNTRTLQKYNPPSAIVGEKVFKSRSILSRLKEQTKKQPGITYGINLLHPSPEQVCPVFNFGGSRPFALCVSVVLFIVHIELDIPIKLWQVNLDN